MLGCNLGLRETKLKDCTCLSGAHDSGGGQPTAFQVLLSSWDVGRQRRKTAAWAAVVGEGAVADGESGEREGPSPLFSVLIQLCDLDRMRRKEAREGPREPASLWACWP